MRDDYGFVASEKMFKDRFRRWGAHKNYSQNDVSDFLASVTAEDGATTIHGKPVRWHRIERRVGHKHSFGGVGKAHKRSNNASRPRKRSNSASSVTSTTESILIQSPPSIALSLVDTSLSVYSGCRAFQMLQNYLEDRLFSVDLLERFFGPVETFALEANGEQDCKPVVLLHPSRLNQNYARGMALLRDNRVKLASALLAQASGALEQLVIDHHPAFASCFLDAFVEAKYELHQGMSGYVSELAVNTALKALGEAHPITALCRFVQKTATDDEQMEQLLFFCTKFCQLFSDRLGKKHKICVYVNLKHFEKLLQLQRLDQAYTHFVDNVEPAFLDIVTDGAVPRKRRAACLCYLRRKAHLLSLVGDHSGAESALRQCVDFAVEWLGERSLSVAGNPLMEECFRLIDEIAGFLFTNGHTVKGVDLHSFAIGLCAAVRGEREGKAIRMISAQLKRYGDAGLDDRVRILQVRFPNVFADNADGLSEPTDHILPCPTCANGPDTQLWCEEHRMLEHVSVQDKVLVRIARKCLADLLRWFGMDQVCLEQ